MGLLANHYDRGVQQVTQEDYCGKQVQMGLSPATCATRFQNYQRRVQGKGAKMEQNWLS